jgi:hypothetical protein
MYSPAEAATPWSITVSHWSTLSEQHLSQLHHSSISFPRIMLTLFSRELLQQAQQDANLVLPVREPPRAREGALLTRVYSRKGTEHPMTSPCVSLSASSAEHQHLYEVYSGDPEQRLRCDARSEAVREQLRSTHCGMTGWYSSSNSGARM